MDSIIKEVKKIKDTVVVYSGRFQPFHNGHYNVYKHLVSKFGSKNVYIGSSNETNSTNSPFSFNEKKQIATTMFGVPSSKFVRIKNPYQPVEILGKYNKKTTRYVTVVGEKDEGRLGGKYFLPYKDSGNETYMDHGYIYLVPPQAGGISGTKVRKNLSNPKTSKEFFKKVYPKYDSNIYKMITKKLSALNEETEDFYPADSNMKNTDDSRVNFYPSDSNVRDAGDIEHDFDSLKSDSNTYYDPIAEIIANAISESDFDQFIQEYFGEADEKPKTDKPKEKDDNVPPGLVHLGYGFYGKQKGGDATHRKDPDTGDVRLLTPDEREAQQKKDEPKEKPAGSEPKLKTEPEKPETGDTEQPEQPDPQQLSGAELVSDAEKEAKQKQRREKVQRKLKDAIRSLDGDDEKFITTNQHQSESKTRKKWTSNIKEGLQKFGTGMKQWAHHKKEMVQGSADAVWALSHGKKIGTKQVKNAEGKKEWQYSDEQRKSQIKHLKHFAVDTALIMGSMALGGAGVAAAKAVLGGKAATAGAAAVKGAASAFTHGVGGFSSHLAKDIAKHATLETLGLSAKRAAAGGGILSTATMGILESIGEGGEAKFATNVISKVAKKMETYELDDDQLLQSIESYKKNKEKSDTLGLFNEFKLIKEEITRELATEINKFVDWGTKRLKLKERPSIKLIQGTEFSEIKSSLGGYQPETKDILVVVEGRLLADILRTVAHEMVHRKQDELGIIRNENNDGKTGSPVENQANAVAGIMLREYGKLNNKIYVEGHSSQHPVDDDCGCQPETNKEQLEESGTAAAVLLMASIVQLMAVLSKAGAFGSGDPKDLWNTLKKKNELRHIKKIANRLKDDEEIKQFLKLSPHQQKGKWRKMLLPKLKDNEKKYLDMLSKKYFDKSYEIPVTYMSKQYKRESLDEAVKTLNVPTDIKKLYNAFKKNGKQLYVVGGAVRDAILGKTPKDYDLATDAKPDEVLAIAKDAGFKTVEVGKSFGVVVVGDYEIATFRKDIGKGRRPDAIEFSDIKSDVNRRDLTINALFFDIGQNKIVDLTGGLKDLKNKIVKTVGDANQRFDEDPLRKLRVLRFQANLGGKLDKDTDSALRRNPSLNGISGERIKDEFTKSIIKAKSPKSYMESVDSFGFTSQILPGLKVSKPYPNENDWILFLAYILRDNEVGMLGKKLNQLKYASKEVNNIQFLVLMTKFDPNQIYMLKKAQERTSLTPAQIQKFGRMIGKDFGKFVKFKLSVGGNDVDPKLKGVDIGKAIKRMETDKFLSEAKGDIKVPTEIPLFKINSKVDKRDLQLRLPKIDVVGALALADLARKNNIATLKHNEFDLRISNNYVVIFLKQPGRFSIRIKSREKPNYLKDITKLAKQAYSKYLQDYIQEDINLDVDIGDEILTGRFKNKKVTVKDIGKDDHNMPTINGKKVVTFRTTKESLQEGGSYGHMSHPFDNMNLTFGDLKKIINDALTGNLKTAVEKTDGVALAISWKNGRLIAARNKGHLANAGAKALGIEGIASKFAGRGALSDAYTFAMNDLNAAVSKLSDAQRKKIFNNGQCFMNLEVIWPQSVNVIPYGQPLLLFHGTTCYDDSGKAISGDSSTARTLAGMIKQVNADVQSKYTITGSPVLELPKNQELSSKKGAFLSKLSKLQSEFGNSDSDTVSMYHQSWWDNFITKNAPTKLDKLTKEALIRRWAFDDKSFRLDSISNEELKKWAINNDKVNVKDQQKKNMMKFEEIFLGVGAEVMKFVSSTLVVNPNKSIRDMKKRLDKVIQDVKKLGDPSKIKKMETELARLSSIGGTDAIVPIEGIVFQYKGKTYKLTGVFAPLNQLVNIFYR